MFGQSRDPLQEALNAKRTKTLYNIPASHSNFFKTSKVDIEHFGMSFSQRIMAFAISMILGAVLFFYSLTRLMLVIFNPAAFALPYALSNITFFFMFGFLSGFKTYFKNLFNKSKRSFTMFFVISTTVTICLSCFYTNVLYTLASVIVQVIAFGCFLVTFIPGGSSGLTSLANLLIKR